MQIRKGTVSDIDAIMPVYDKARAFMKQSGNSNQWINGYPSREVILNDIEQGHNYICIDDQQEIVGVFCFTRGKEDPTYHTIYEGEWLNSEAYGVIHRIASTGKVKGVAQFCFDWCFEQCGNIRIDTHEENRVMQHLLKRNGYTYCGIIYTHNGGKRVAFQKTR